MKQSFTKLFVAFLALLLAPSGVWADSFTFGSTTTAADCKTQFGNDTDLDTEGAITTLSFGNDYYNGAELDLVINSALEIQIAEGLTVNLQSLTCNAPVTVFGGGTLNITNGSGNVVTINDGGSFTIGKNDQESPMNVNITTTGEFPCLYYMSEITEIVFTVIGSNVTVSGGQLTSDFDIGGDEEYPSASYSNCTLTFEDGSAIFTADTNSESANLSVSGTAIDVSADVLDVLGDGKVSYNAETMTLTLADGAALTSIVNNSVEGLIIDVLGTATIASGENQAIFSACGLTLKSSNGEGTLTLTSSEAQFGTFYVYGNPTEARPVSIEGIHLIIDAVTGINIVGSLSIDNASTLDITVADNEFPISVSYLANNECSLPATAIGANDAELTWVLESGMLSQGAYYLDGGNGNQATKELHIAPAPAPAATYYFSFGSLESLTAVTPENVDEVLENSGLSYDADNNTLTISEGAEIDAICTGNPTGTEVNDGLTINVAGDAAVREIDIYADAIITGDGMLTMGSDQGTGANGAIVFKKNADLNFANANITIYKSGATGEYGIYYVDGVETMGLTFDNSNVTISSFNVVEDEVGYAIYGLSEPTLNDCSITASTPSGTVAWVHDTFEDADDYYYTTGDDEENWWGNRVYNLTIMRDSEAPVADEVDDVFYTETEIGDGVLSIPYTVLTLADGDTPGEVMLGVDPYGDDHAATYTGSGQIDFEIPESVTSPNGSTYNVTVGNTISTDLFNPITFIKTLTIPATLTEFRDEFLGYIAAPIKDLEKPGLEKVIFADGSVQDAITTGDMNMAFMTGFVLDGMDILETDAVELVIPDDWDDVMPDWGGGKWVGDKIVELVHYEIWLNQYGATEEGIEVTNLNKDDVLDDGGSITYDPDSKELTITTDIVNILNGNTGYIDMRPGVDGLKIVIPEGEEVTISMDGMEGMDPAITIYNNTIITGGGTLNVEHRANDVIQIGGSFNGSTVVGSLTVKDVTMNVYAIGSTAQAIRFANAESSLVVNHATLNLECQDGGNEGPAEDVVMYGLAGNEPTFINCSITTPTTPPTWASLTGYWNTNVTNEAYRAYGYQVPQLTIVPGEDFVAEVEDGSYDDLTVGLNKVTGKDDEVVISSVETGETATDAVIIPQTVTASDNSVYTVTGIGDAAFQNQTNLTGATLPRTVTSIGENAFAGCTNMESLTLQSPFAPTIGTGAFDASANLTVNYPAAAYNNYNNAEWTGVTTFQPTVMQPNEWSTICSTQDYDVPEGLEAYVVVGIDYVNCAIQVRKENCIQASTPMMLRRTGAAENYAVGVATIAIISGTGVLPSVIGDEDAFVGYAPASADADPMEIPDVSGSNNMQAYILIGNSFVKWTSGTLAPYRCFLWATQEFNTASPARMAIEVVDGVATGVGDVRGKKEDVRSNWYDLSGRRLQSQPTKKGVYINNGKLMIK